LTSISRRLYSVCLFIRFSALGGTTLLPLLGAGSVHSALPLTKLLGLLGMAFLFHLFAYIFNDVIDLELDRSEPRRANFPLVRGIVKPTHALIFSLAQIPLAAGIAIWMQSNWLAYATLAIAFGGMAVYNLWGKRARYPLLTDFAQGMSWAALALFGAASTVGGPNVLTIFLCAYLIVFICLGNGVHGSLRDLTNDFQRGVRSMAIFLGAQPTLNDELDISAGLRRYAFALQYSLLAICLIPLVRNDFGYSLIEWLITMGGILLLGAFSLRLLDIAAKSGSHRQTLISAGMLQLLVSLGLLIMLFAFYLPTWLLELSLVLFFLPLLTHGWLYDMLRWIRQRWMAWLGTAHSVDAS
jgi:4-hydroxybenzoate polyprenyltransferase